MTDVHDCLIGGWLREDCVGVIVEWWVDQVLNQIEQNKNMPTINTRQQEHEIEFFRIALRLEITAKAARDGWIRKGRFVEPSLLLYCEYGPAGVLANAAEYAKIHAFNFPWKTKMWINRNAVYVKSGEHGYRQQLI
jgi:hypothetical protein